MPSRAFAVTPPLRILTDYLAVLAALVESFTICHGFSRQAIIYGDVEATSTEGSIKVTFQSYWHSRKVSM